MFSSPISRAEIPQKMFFIGAVILVGLGVYMQIWAEATGDKEWLLLAARKLLSGKHLYADIFETNPPLILWLYSLPVSFSLYPGFPTDTQCLALLALGVVAISILLSMRVMAFHPEFAGNNERQGAFALLLCFIFIFWTIPNYFAGREPLFLALAFPYLLRCSPTLAGVPMPRRLRIMIGCMGAVGFCIKPQCMIVFLGMQALVVARERSQRILWSLENRILYVGGLVYLLSVWLLTPDFLTTVLPMEWATYRYFTWGFHTLYFTPSFLMLAPAFLAFRRGKVSPYRKDVLYFLAVCLTMLLYVFANNGWNYTFYPLDSMAAFTVAWLWWEYRWLRRDAEGHGTLRRSWFQGGYVCGLLLGCKVALMLIVDNILLSQPILPDADREISVDLIRLVRQHHVHSFASLAPIFQPFTALENSTDAHMETRFHHLWMMQAFAVAGEDFAKEYRWIPAYVAGALAEDMDRRKPGMIFVDTSPEFYSAGKPFALIAYFSKYPAFREAWTHYHYLEDVDHCSAESGGSTVRKRRDDCRYAVYERQF